MKRSKPAGRSIQSILGYVLLGLLLSATGLMGQDTAADQQGTEGKTTVEKSGGDAESRDKKSQEKGRFLQKEITVTATRTRTLSERLPVTAYTVGQEEMEQQPGYGRNNYGELIRDVPGVNVGESVQTAPPWINLRGTGYFVGRTQYLVDGLPVASSTTPMMTTCLNNNNIEQIDVVLGPGSALYGANAAGGVVNLITRQGSEDVGAFAALGYGSRNTWRPSAGAGNRVGNFHYYVSYNGDMTDGYKMRPLRQMLQLYSLGAKSNLNGASVEDVGYRNHNFYAKVGWEHDGAGFFVNYNYAAFNIDGGQINRRSVDNGKQGIGSVRAWVPIGDAVKVSAAVGHQFWDRPSTSTTGLSLTAYNATPTTRSESKTRRIPAEIQTDITIGEYNVTTVGGFFSTEKLETDVLSRTTHLPSSQSSTTTNQYAAFLQNQTFLLDKRLTILLGVRYDRWQYKDIYDTSSVSAYSRGLNKFAWTYRGGVKYRINDYIAVRSSAGTAFWPGAASWLFQNTSSGTTWREANRRLKPERTWMVDGGVEITIGEWGTTLGLTPYYGRIQDMILYRYDQHPTLPAVDIVRTRNVAEAEIYGVEILFTQRFGQHLMVFLSHTQNHSRIIRDRNPFDVDHPTVKGNQVANSPDFHGSAGLRFLYNELFNFSASVRYADWRFYDNDNTQAPCYHMRPFVTLDLKIWRDWYLTDELILSTAFSVNDVFDTENYFTEFYTISPGRTWMVNLGMRYLY
ncbi:MAG: TonB-dependent receptor plug domain-containing protein [Spirochaetes bacterium]|nr:TonB-dependent receptor plug domain-containing protein [Spirochaetota bacterium]